MPREKRKKSEAKKNAISNNRAIQAWRTAAQEMGYLKAGKFVPIPAKNSPEYVAIKQRQQALLAQPLANGPPAAVVVPVVVPEAQVPPQAPAAVPKNPFIESIKEVAVADGIKAL